jgi:hypothetical protein
MKFNELQDSSSTEICCGVFLEAQKEQFYYRACRNHKKREDELGKQNGHKISKIKCKLYDTVPISVNVSKSNF